MTSRYGNADPRPDSYAPIGVMGDHTQQMGEVMLSYRYLLMEMESNLDGIDPAIVAPIQTADPDRHAAQRLDGAIGVNFLLPGEKQRIALELNKPIRQDLDGSQMETDWYASLGWQFTF